MKWLIVLAFVAFVEAATDEGHAERLRRAKRASESASASQLLSAKALSDHSLLLLPVDGENGVDDDGIVGRWKREIDTNRGNSSKSESEGKKKYHRLAHSLHVQSDIRYR